MTTLIERTHHQCNPQHNVVDADLAVGDMQRMFCIRSRVNWCQKASEAS